MNTLKLLVSTALVTLTFSVPLAVHGMEREQKGPPEMELRNQGIQREAPQSYQEAAEAQRAEEAEQQRIKEHEEAELRERKAIFAIRESMIDDCINTYRVLTTPGLNYGQLHDACIKVFPGYDSRKIVMEKHEAPDNGTAQINRLWLFSQEGRLFVERQNSRLIVGLLGNGMKGVRKMGKVIKQDVIEMMGVYERLYGHPHPRSKEFAKI